MDRFLRGDYDIWRWTDVVVEGVDPVTGVQELALAELKFKNLPTLPVYMLAVMTWLSARERAVRLGRRGPPGRRC